MPRRLRALPAALLVAALAVPAAHAAVPTSTYSYVDLGADFTPTAINASRQVVGMKSGHGVVWTEGAEPVRPTDLMVGGSGPLLTDINDAGRIAGTGALSGSVTHAAWWSISDLLSPHDAGALRQVAFGEDINAAGDVLGSTDDNVNGTIRMQVSPAGGAPVAVGPTDRDMLACGISDAGAVLGEDQDSPAADRLILTPPGGGTSGTTLPGMVLRSCGSAAVAPPHAVAPDGAIATNDASGRGVVFRDASGVQHNLTPDRPTDQSYKVNAVVGTTVVGERDTPGQVAVAWLDGGWVDLNRFAPPGATLRYATDVNANGDIVGGASYGSSAPVHGFLLKAGAGTTAPPPSGGGGTTTSPPAVTPPVTPPTVPPYDVLPPANPPNSRVIDAKTVPKGLVPRVTVKRDGITYLAGPGATFQKGDVISTDDHTTMVLEFVIGGRVSLNTGTEIKIVNDRSVSDAGTIQLLLTTGKAAVDYFAPDPRPIEIQTNGGVLGIKG